jgi:hypothetical protein
VTFLAAYYDPAIKLKDGETKESICLQERERLTRLVAVAKHAQTIPRRLGGEATSEMLSADKKRCRRIQHAAEQCLEDWGGPVPNGADVSRDAAQVVWESWWEQQRVHLDNRLRYIATWGIAKGEERWAKSAVVWLTNETRFVEYALR